MCARLRARLPVYVCACVCVWVCVGVGEQNTQAHAHDGTHARASTLGSEDFNLHRLTRTMCHTIVYPGIRAKV